MVITFAIGNFNIRFTSRVYALIGVLILYSLYGTFILGVSYGLLSFLSYLPAILLFMLDEKKQNNLLQYITKWISIILGVSLVIYLLSSFIQLPHFSFLPPQLANSYTPFENYIFFLKNTSMYEEVQLNITRFSGPFLEPGHQSMVCSFLLFANRFQMRKEPLMWILVVSVLMSFSLAGYLLLVIGFCLIKIKNVYSIIISGVIVASGIFVVTNVWNNGDNAINVLIFDRLEFDSSKGIKGNNRTIKQTDYFFKQCVDDGTIWLGVQTQKEMKLKIRGAGYKIFLLRYGIGGAIFVGLIYLLLIPAGVNRRYAISFLILISITFLQRAYPSWYSWLLPYTLGLGIMRYRSFNGNRIIEDYEVGLPEREDAASSNTDDSFGTYNTIG